ncbi:MAG: redox-regulated ATPase YchF [Spirochaetota bacterium]
MGFTSGIIGLPNVGKTTIFNALCAAGASMANYPFTTIEPNKGVVTVPDERLYKIAEILGKSDPIPTRIEFFDVAGLVKGASKGEGLGNKFLAHIREVDALVHVVRCFYSENVAHVTGDVDPVRDVEIVNTELMLSDMEILQKAASKLGKTAQAGDRDARAKFEVVQRCLSNLNEGRMLNTLDLNTEEKNLIREFGLITLKPVLYCANSDEGDLRSDAVKKLEEYARRYGSAFISITGKLEEEIAELPEGEKQEYLKAMGITESSLRRMIEVSYGLLELITFYTATTYLQAWTVRRGTTAQKAAGKIHTDFERGFVRAEVYRYVDLVEAGSEHRIRELGKLRSEGRDYVVEDGDIMHFLFH